MGKEEEAVVCKNTMNEWTQNMMNQEGKRSKNGTLLSSCSPPHPPATRIACSGKYRCFLITVCIFAHTQSTYDVGIPVKGECWVDRFSMVLKILILNISCFITFRPMTPNDKNTHFLGSWAKQQLFDDVFSFFLFVLNKPLFSFFLLDVSIYFVFFEWFYPSTPLKPSCPAPIMVSVLQQLVLLTAIVCQCTCVTSTCSRLLSRRVRKFLQTDVFPRLPIAPTDLPSQCQLNPIHDIYYDQEEVNIYILKNYPHFSP